MVSRATPGEPPLPTRPRPAKTSTSAELRVDAPTGTPLPNPLASEAAPAAGAPANAHRGERRPDTPAAVEATPPALQASSPGDAPLLISYAGPSWTEIRDRSGQLVVSRLVAANSVEPVPGNPPFDIVLGNAHAVTLSYHGKNVDLAPYTRGNIARLTLQ